MRTEPNAGRDVDADLVEDVGGKTDRVVALGYRRPDIEGRARRLDLPAQAVQRVGHEPMPARVNRARGARLIFAAAHRLNRGPLDRLEDPGVDVRLQLADQLDQVGPDR